MWVVLSDFRRTASFVSLAICRHTKRSYRLVADAIAVAASWQPHHISPYMNLYCDHNDTQLCCEAIARGIYMVNNVVLFGSKTQDPVIYLTLPSLPLSCPADWIHVFLIRFLLHQNPIQSNEINLSADESLSLCHRSAKHKTISPIEINQCFARSVYRL